MTCLYATYDPALRHRVAARAGHIPPAQVTSGGKARLVDFPVGPPLGLGGLPFEAASIHMPEGSILALFSDGLGPSRTTQTRSMSACSWWPS
ncbi:SpoIIE family protein phosphatase [Streptomyces sp. NPDC058466]|uniref:SpoIIE family protein phosphatase n=1 Tax=Streptomyces sp. NPDC058466 TaxID=3346512 RepID=UPI003657AA19